MSEKIIVFCNDLLNPNKVDVDFESEYNAAKQAGFKPLLISHEELIANESVNSINKIVKLEHEGKAIYRGWMLTGEQYKRLYTKLLGKNIVLINSPEAYDHAHYLPNAYPIIEAYTAKSVFIDLASNEPDYQQISKSLETFGNKPIIIKDYVKSEKHYWKEACFIPDASNSEIVKNVTDKFLELRGSYLNKGLAYRAFLNLEPLTEHAKSGMPLSKEFRAFFMAGSCIAFSQYWDGVTYNDLTPAFSELEVLKDIRSNFFSVDIAKTTEGKWLIIELGDGQVSGIPENVDLEDFYHQLYNGL
ncbi:MAG: hypothetical protein CMO01_17665 [Thalassobius sp.]|nr:hypothetical protein [Thalassovita sp.]